MIFGAAAVLGRVWRVAELRVGVAGSVVAGLAPVVLLGICGVVPEGGKFMHVVVMQSNKVSDGQR